MSDSTELAELRRWKSEAIEVIGGLQDLGRALGIGLGQNITGRSAVDAALDLRNERDAAREQVRQRDGVIERVRALAEDPARHRFITEAHTGYTVTRYGEVLVRVDDLRALLDGDQG